MSDSPLSFVSSSSFRNTLISKNLKPYSVPGVYTPQSSNTTYEPQISNYNVVNSPDNLISEDPFAKDLYPLNQYGPNGGYNLNISYNQSPQPVKSNSGEYDPNDTKLDIINEFFIDAAAVLNGYIPQGGYNDMVTIDDVENKNKLHLPYWTPPSFRPSSYSPYSILISNNPTGDNGSLSNDSYLARLGAKNLKNSLQNRIDAELYLNTSGVFNLSPLSNPYEASLLSTGQQSLVSKNWRISVPENQNGGGFDLLTRLTGSYSPTSFIPGDYFNEDELNAGQTPQIRNALNIVNRLTGGFLGPIINATRNPSEIFLANTGSGQKSTLFNNLNFNKYQPSYDKNFGGILVVAQAAVSLAVSLVNPNGTLNSSYYVGSRNAEPSTVTSPPNQVPTNAFGKQIQSPVYGPSELGVLYEGNQNNLNFGLAGKTHTDGGGIDGQFVWTSPKYKGGAGYKATPGGGKGSLDREFNQISSSYDKSQSTNIDFKPSSILDQTQRLVESADNIVGKKRLQHVGNAINQVSKVFNDGYKELTKGSQVVSYKDFTTGQEKGIEYCRVFTKDTPYYTYADLQKTDGITTSGRRFTNSVLDNTYNLNIAPLRNPGSTNIQPNEKGDLVAKKYMFSIENLAWRTSSRPGFTYEDLPVCEKGPNGGRVMWFPPYDLSFNDSSTANWTPTDFMGRPEPIYTYKNTNRTGSISWKILVDNPSVTNIIVEQQLKGANKERVNSILDSFFAGCVKYDIYELGKKFNKIPAKDLYTFQEILNNPQLTPAEVNSVVKSIQKDNSTTNGQANVDTNDKSTNPDESLKKFEDEYKELGFYFENDVPKTSSESYQSTYDSYTSNSNIEKYTNQANAIFKEDTNYCKKNVEHCNNAKQVKDFFETVIKYNYTKIAGENTNNFITDAYDILKNNKGTIQITMIGAASAVATNSYNQKLSQRRIDIVKNFLKTKVVGGVSLSEFIDKQLTITSEKAEGETAEEKNVLPKANGGSGFEVNCTDDIIGGNGAVTPNSQTFSVNAMACRRVKINKIIVTPIVKKDESKNQGNIDEKTISNETIVPKKPQPQVTIKKTQKEGISKMVLRKLLSECDYFDVIKENTPFLYDSIKEKIKYFNPAFHSMTPEGLNARLTFLNQCVRPGETIPVIGTDGKPKHNDAYNTSFGAPPVLILRIGDFYHTKIIPQNLSITYDPLIFDMNPEGIGLQPMIAKVTLSFSMIGGHGLAKPVEQLQNALSFNYYGNTEIYDERSVWTEDTSKLDKQILDSIVAGEKTAETKDVVNKKENNGGNTIGDIITNIPVPSGQTGEIAYQKIMDKLQDMTKTYMENVTNTMEKIVLQTNYGIEQLINDKRKYIEGNIDTSTTTTPSAILYGKPENQEDRFNKLFERVITDISNDENPILKEFSDRGYEFTVDVVRPLKENLINYVKDLQESIKTSTNTLTQELVSFQQDYVQIIRKCNLINTKTDGKILDNGTPRVYSITETDKVSKSTTTVDPTIIDTYKEFWTDYSTIRSTLNEFDKLLQSKIIVPNAYTDGDFIMGNDKNFDGISNKLFFMVISRVFNDKDKKEDFKNKIISGSLSNVKQPVNLKNKFSSVVDDIAKKYSKEINDEEKIFKDFKKSREYKQFVDGIIEKTYPKGKYRKFTYTTVPGPNNATQTDDITKLYKTVNLDTNNTWNGKVKFL